MVFMVNMLRGEQLAFQVFFHNISMFKESFSFDTYSFIATTIKPTCSVFSSFWRFKWVPIPFEFLVVFPAKLESFLKILTVYYGAWLSHVGHSNIWIGVCLS